MHYNSGINKKYIPIWNNHILALFSEEPASFLMIIVYFSFKRMLHGVLALFVRVSRGAVLRYI